MCAGSVPRREHREEHREYREQYRRCLEREFPRGCAGACSDRSFEERLRRRLRRDPALLGALQEEAPALLAHGLRGRPDAGPALRGLAAAFGLLETAAANLYLFPWRKEFGTVQTFSGAYVHWLRPALPEADLLQSFARLGYERRDRHRLAISRPRPGPELAAAACGFFACRLECEILEEMVLRLRPRRLRPEELLEARRLAGDAEACVDMLRLLPAACGDGVDLYREMPAGSEDAAPAALWRDPGDAAPAALWKDPGDTAPAALQRGPRDVTPPALWKDPGDVTPPALWKDPSSPWGTQDCYGAGEPGQEPVPSPGNPSLDISCSSSRLFPQQELGAAGSPLSALAAGSGSPQVPGNPQDLPPTAPQEAPALPCYQLHSCLRQGALPSYCCSTCQQLHASACAAGQACRSRHRGQELRSERQRRLWLQRTEVDMLLADGSGPWA